MTHLARLAPLALFALSITSGCYLSHPSERGVRCGSSFCDAGDQCCPTCGGEGVCVAAGRPCPDVFCEGCESSADCAPSEYCARPEGACGAPGECAPRPDGCDDDCPVVCGCDGADYCNACGAASVGVTVAREGSCSGETCGDSGVVCGPGSTCCPLCRGEGLCVPEGEPCPEVECPSCFGPFDCGPGEVCIYELGTCGGPGTCTPTPGACDPDCPGVCGCDGTIFCNECQATGAGMSLAALVPCSSICGPRAELCPPTQYCDFGPECGGYEVGTCVDRPVVCTGEDDPVCGCDGETYGNACLAASRGVTVTSRGPCEPCPEGECWQSCREVQRALPGAPSGVYPLRSPDGRTFEVYCDLTTDGGGWTLVGSTWGTPFADEASRYYADLTTTTPESAHRGIWDGLRFVLGPRSDVRFTCSGRFGAVEQRVDMSFYDVVWYEEWTRGSDADSCFSEGDGVGFDSPPPARRDNVTGRSLPIGTTWRAGYLEGEDSCDDGGDFTVDFEDRGMDSNQMDGTDWGEDDGQPKCGANALPGTVWHVWVR